MTELDAGEPTVGEQQSEAARRAHTSRRNFMRKVFFASGATSVVIMGGPGAWAATADDSTGTAPATASPTPSGGPGGGTAGPGNQSITEELFGLITDGKRIDDLFTIHSTGVATAPVITAPNTFLAGLTDTQKTSRQSPRHAGGAAPTRVRPLRASAPRGSRHTGAVAGDPGAYRGFSSRSSGCGGWQCQ